MASSTLSPIGSGPRCIAYLRVSTQRQGSSGLGVQAQRKAVAEYVKSVGGSLAAEFVEVESGAVDARPKLEEALQACELYGAKLVIAKLDRLGRDAHFLIGLQKAGVPFVAADMPSANELTVGIMALVAQEERKMISQRTKAALQAAKARGVKLGNPQNLRNREVGSARGKATQQANANKRAAKLTKIIREIQAAGIVTGRAIAEELNRLGYRASRGGEWQQKSVANMLKRIEG